MLGVAQQPLGATRFSILGQAADGGFRLLAIAMGHVAHQGGYGIGQAVQAALKCLQRDAAQAHPGVGHHIDTARPACECKRRIQPRGAFDHAELVTHLPFVTHTQHYAAAVEVQDGVSTRAALAQQLTGGNHLCLGQGIK